MAFLSYMHTLSHEMAAHNTISVVNGTSRTLTSISTPILSTPMRFLTVTLQSSDATIPTKGSALAAGYDLYAAEDKLILPLENALISTDITIVLPLGTYGRIAARSGLALKHNLMVGGGVIDSDYTGIVKVILFNFSKIPFHVKKRERIAQLICEQIVYPHICISNALTPNTERGNAGFGSTGM